MPTQQDQMIIKGIKGFNSSQVITTQNKKKFLKILFEKGFWFRLESSFWLNE